MKINNKHDVNYYDVCQTKCAANKSLDQIIRNMPPDDQLRELADFFKIFGEHTRIRIISALYNCELCVCDLVDILEMNQSAISHQLRVLRSAKIVKYRKDGKNIYYSLDDDRVYKLMRDALEHIRENRSTGSVT